MPDRIWVNVNPTGHQNHLPAHASRRMAEEHAEHMVCATEVVEYVPAQPEAEAPMVHLFVRCPDCGKDGAHHTYENRAGEKAGVRCG